MVNGGEGMSEEKKNSISHRSVALNKMLEYIKTGL